SSCDLLAQETIAASQTDAEATAVLYGYVVNSDDTRVTVHVASVCKNAGRIDARASFGLYWGNGSRHNAGRRIPDRQSDGRAILLGVHCALSYLAPDRPVAIHTTSKYAIRAICYRAGPNYTQGWGCPNGDLLEGIVAAICGRTTQTSFIFVE
ncbi:hypothetical protein B0H11DRAFT_1650255, partial [Mycena galericulata]